MKVSMAASRRGRDAGVTGFTLVELLVVIAIIGTLVGLLLPAVQAAREAARRSTCTNNVKQLALGFQVYHDANNILPSAENKYTAAGYWQVPFKTWAVDLMPFIEMADAYSKFDPAIGLRTSDASKALDKVVYPTARCPSNPYAASFKPKVSSRYADGNWPGGNTQTSCYSVCTGPAQDNGCGLESPCGASVGCESCSGNRWLNSLAESPGMFKPNMFFQCRLKNVTDGLSKTIMLSERRGELNSYGGGVFSSDVQGVCTWLRINSSYINENSDTDASNRGASSNHPGGATFAMADGAVVFLENDTDYIVYNRLGNRADGKVVSLP